MAGMSGWIGGGIAAGGRCVAVRLEEVCCACDFPIGSAGHSAFQLKGLGHAACYETPLLACIH